MWESIARLVLKFRLYLLILLFFATAFMAYHATKVTLSYDSTRTIPTDNPKYLANQAFRQKFGDDGNLLVIAVQTDKLFQKDIFSDYISLNEEIKKVPGVDAVLSVPVAINLEKDSNTQKLKAVPVFPVLPADQAQIDTGNPQSLHLPLYPCLLSTPPTTPH